MNVLPADQFPGAEHQPLAYPGLRPNFSYVYYQGKVYEITPQGETNADLWLEDSTGRVTLDAFLVARGNPTMSERHAVLAVGSNGCPGRLAEKYGDQPEVALPVFVGTLADTAVVYSRRLVWYGALPATYLHQPGAVSWLSVTMLTDDQLKRMDETESVGEFYLRIPVSGHFRIDGGPKVDNLTAYLDREILSYQGKPIRLKMFAREGPDWPMMDEPEVLSLVLDQAGLLRGEAIEKRHSQLLQDEKLRTQVIELLDTRMAELIVDKRGQLSAYPFIKCTRVCPTSDRPGSEGTYIVRLSPANVRQLNLAHGVYLKLSYGQASVLACLSVDNKLDDETIRMDQTLRTAICLEPIMQGTKKKELVYRPGDGGELSSPIIVQSSAFHGPTLLAKLLKHQYLMCLVHHAMSEDMEKPIARLTNKSMEVISIDPGDKVLLIGENRRKSMRCLALDPEKNLPADTMRKTFTGWRCPELEDKDLHLPWVTLDLQTRRELGVDPWEPIIVGRDPYHTLVAEFSEVALAVALGAVGGALFFQGLPVLQFVILLFGFVAIVGLILSKIQSRI
ncbi:MAG: hypothetical protein V3W05_06490 [candidate division NC10 bacterium]